MMKGSVPTVSGDLQYLLIASLQYRDHKHTSNGNDNFWFLIYAVDLLARIFDISMNSFGAIFLLFAQFISGTCTTIWRTLQKKVWFRKLHCSVVVAKDHTYALPYPLSPPPFVVLDVDDVSCNTTVETSAVEAEESWEGSITRCICGFQHDDGFMICCDRCW